MLNDLPKKEKVRKPLTPWRYFWRIQKECALRAVTPFMMYLFMSLIALAVQAISPDSTVWYEVVLGALCIVIGAAFNAHLLFTRGKMHYDAYLTGRIHEKNRLFGVESGGDHRPEKEYRPWKGFLIGFYIGVPVLVFGLFAAIPVTWSGGEVALVMFAGWAIYPIQWLRAYLYPGQSDWAYPPVSGGYSMLMILLPVLVSGIFYLVGAMVQRREKEREAERAEQVARAAEQARLEAAERQKNAKGAKGGKKR